MGTPFGENLKKLKTKVFPTIPENFACETDSYLTGFFFSNYPSTVAMQINLEPGHNNTSDKNPYLSSKEQPLVLTACAVYPY